MLISGMSFFTDAYDLFVIGVVLLMVRGMFSLSAVQLGLLASIALFGAAIGPIIFGFLGDKVGRRYTYWLTVSILIVAAIGSALSFSFIQLVLWRFILGIGIGGDYPLSATIVAEYANKNDRGKLISSTFAMQGFGIIAGGILAVALLYLNVPVGIAWRILLSAGAIPTLTILYARTKLAETPWYSLYKSSAAGTAQSKGRKARRAGKDSLRSFRIGFRDLWQNNWKYMIGTTASWFILDVSYYGTSIFTPYLATFFGFSGLFGPTLASALILIIAAVPGYWVAVALIDREGRKPMQLFGFLAMCVLFVALALLGKTILEALPLAFFAIYGLTFFFSNYGPNTTTYVYPVELYPTQYRARGHGVAAMAGKFGAAISTLAFPVLILQIGKFGVMGMLGAVAFVGFIVTIVFLPETKKRSLFETSGETSMLLVTQSLYAQFELMIEKIDESMLILRKRIEGKIDNEKLFQDIKRNEHECDVIVHDVLDYIASARLNSMTYRDVSHMAERLDDVMDGIEAVAARFKIYEIDSIEPAMVEMVDDTEKCIEYMRDSVGLISGLQGNRNAADQIRENAISAAKYENMADDLLRSSLHEIIKAQDFRYVIKYKEVYEHMERISDRCMDVIDTINDIVIRYIYFSKGRRRLSLHS